jgi:hypothetical protein
MASLPPELPVGVVDQGTVGEGGHDGVLVVGVDGVDVPGHDGREADGVVVCHDSTLGAPLAGGSRPHSAIDYPVRGGLRIAGWQQGSRSVTSHESLT